MANYLREVWMRCRFSSLAGVLFAVVGCNGADPQPGTEPSTGPGSMAGQSTGTGDASAIGASSAGAQAPSTSAAAGATNTTGAHAGEAGSTASATTSTSMSMAMSMAMSTSGSAQAAASGGAGAGASGMAAQTGASGEAMPGASGSASDTPMGSAGMAPGTPVALSDMQTLVPDLSWDCGMPDGIPGPATGELAFEITFKVSEVHDLGQTQFGHRLQIDVSGGDVTGPKLTASLMDRGLDYQLTLENGAVELEQIHILQAGGSSVYMRNCGVAPSAEGPIRVVLDFEAPTSSSVGFLNMGTYIGVREFDAAAKTLTMKVYEVSGPADSTDVVKVPPPAADTPHNTWACKPATGSKGAEVYRENVGIGSSVLVGDSKRGTRNIIPITGGTTTGRVPGKVLSGGADFQIIENGSFKEIDARYSVETDEGEIIIVRNCGPLGGLVPVFETAKDGKYSWLNANTWLSSDPGLGVGSVNLTIYEGQ